MKYEIILYWEEEDNCFVAEVPELKGCLAHGQTEEVAIKNIKEAMALYIETLKENNLEVPIPKRYNLVLS